MRLASTTLAIAATLLVAACQSGPYPHPEAATATLSEVVVGERMTQRAGPWRAVHKDVLELHFAPGSSQIEALESIKLAEFLDDIENPGDARIHVEGHADTSGSAAGNRVLAEQRAASIRQALRDNGFTAAQLVKRSYGDRAPKVSNETREGRDANRRVLVTVYHNAS